MIHVPNPHRPRPASWTPKPSATFDIPVHEIRRGYRSDVYFWRSKVVLEKSGLRATVLMQVFQKQNAIVCGMDEALAVIQLCSGYYRDPDAAYMLFDEYIRLKQHIRAVYHSDREEWLQARRKRVALEEKLDNHWIKTATELEINSLRDGDSIQPYETVLTIEGPLSYFAHLETIYLGVLARRTRIATNVHRVVEAANQKPVLFFPARFDHWTVQGGDGYAARIGGAALVSTDAQGAWWGAEGAGTTPHALIAACNGDTTKAADLFHQYYPNANLIALVDFHNDCVQTALEVARSLGSKLWGVRLDTSQALIDRSVTSDMSPYPPTGVTPQLVFKVRDALDREGFTDVKIVVSGGFNRERIAAFEQDRVPVDAYGVGSAFLKGQFDFTADVVQVNGKPMAKVGRRLNPNPRLIPVQFG
ncbi:MAG: quinolinate phosphoribosyl transferase [Fidelibacterota bacterium]